MKLTLKQPTNITGIYGRDADKGILMIGPAEHDLFVTVTICENGSVMNGSSRPYHSVESMIRTGQWQRVKEVEIK